MKLPQLPQDKANHFIYGALIYLLSSIWILHYPSLFIVASFAFFKEFADSYKDSADFSVWDFLVTVLGGAFVLISQTIN